MSAVLLTLCFAGVCFYSIKISCSPQIPLYFILRWLGISQHWAYSRRIGSNSRRWFRMLRGNELRELPEPSQAAVTTML